MSFVKKLISGPKLPTPAPAAEAPPPVPEKDNADAKQAAEDQRQRARLAQGRGSTILTGGLLDNSGKKASLLLGG